MNTYPMTLYCKLRTNSFGRTPTEYVVKGQRGIVSFSKRREGEEGRKGESLSHVLMLSMSVFQLCATIWRQSGGTGTPEVGPWTE